ncbi:TMV resistance protein N-like [Nicotiana tabacum]|uniref:ADP-ribosyl cyclase/cyclic ADP-ribose hydrolase n=1 Tax=Nicotiana tabacum TaxID=4097 RepID=A9CR77_TOBAC|nr:TMV resistance protein N-like [Nicotiana tabacum]BAF95888.1 N-like protein [Nicotiana tabacum]
MASPSPSSSSSARWSYDVFLSFRGEDTRKTFTSHLYEVLKDRGIKTFQDEKRLEYGATIPEELSKAIEESQFAIVVFSKNYATSRWCLNELVKIMECKTQFRQTVIPIFYDVDPSHVRNQKESFAKAFEEHETKYKDDAEGIQRWRIALNAAANLKGSCDNRDKSDADCIRQIVGQISSKLCKISLSYLQNIVGIDTHLKKIESLLEIGINDVRVVGICGMGGVGKTTIARAMFDTLLVRRDSSYQFDGACFLEDIKENKGRINSLQNTLLSKLLREKAEYNNKEDGKHQMASRLRSKKVLIVLDDIDDKDHYLEYLAGDLDWFGNGSRIIVTTRDKHLIEKFGIHLVTALTGHEAIQLFNQYAFGKEVSDEHFKKLSLEVVKYAKGLPLALRVLGSSLRNRGITVWKSAIEQMKNNPNSKIVENLKISYDGLEPIQQEMFLDIACFFRGKEKGAIMQVLKSCDCGAEYGLDVLIERSLVFITKYSKIEMHDLIQEMGRYIVNLQKNLGECSRLWLTKDFEEMMINNTGTMAMEAIWVSTYSTLRISNEAMKNMKRLRILYIDNWTWSSDGSYITHDGSIEYLSNNLRWFVLPGYPRESLPSTFEPKMLVHLKLSGNSLRYLWMETKHLPSLRRIDLSRSKRLMRTPDFTGMPNLEYLDLTWCSNLEEVHHSLGCCRKLIRLDLYNCKSLMRFPCVNVESLEYLGLEYCDSLEKFPEIHRRMKPEIQIHMGDSGIRELPSSYFQYQTHITKLDLSGIRNLVALPSSICRLKSLVRLNVWGCPKLESLPEEIGDLDNLEELDAKCTLISRPPSSIVRLNKLKILSFSSFGYDGVHFEFPPVAEGLHSLEHLDLSYCNLIDGGLPEDIGSLSSLKELCLDGNNFEHLPRSIAQLGALQILDLSDCKRLTQLPELHPGLNVLHVDCHMALKFFRDLVTKRKKLQRVGLDDAHNDSIYNLFAHALFQNISSLRHDIFASDSLSESVFSIVHPWKKIPSWFHHQGRDSSVSANLPKNWYIPDKFLGFAVCYSGRLIDSTAELISVCDDVISWMTQKLALSNHSEWDTESNIHFFLVPLAVLWDTSKANGKTPNDYGLIRLFFSGEVKKYGLRLLYKEDPEVEALLQMRKNNNEPIEHSTRIRRIRYNNSEHDFMINEASCSSGKKQKSHF